MQKIIWTLFFVFLGATTNLFSQDRAADLTAISNKDYTPEEIAYYNHPKKNNTAPIQYSNKSFLVRNTPVHLFFKGLMFVYQKAVSPQISAGCMYETTCSNFSKAAIHEFGLLKGVFLSADRLLRCNKMSANDIPANNFVFISGKAIDEPSKYRIWNK